MRRQLSLIILLLASFGTFSQEMITDRPDQTESASTVPKFRFQLETGGSLEVINKLKTMVLPGSLFRYGIGNNIELRLTTSLRYRHQETDTVNDSIRKSMGHLLIWSIMHSIMTMDSPT